MRRFLTYHDMDFSDGRMLNVVSQEDVGKWVKK